MMVLQILILRLILPILILQTILRFMEPFFNTAFSIVSKKFNQLNRKVNYEYVR